MRNPAILLLMLSAATWARGLGESRETGPAQAENPGLSQGFRSTKSGAVPAIFRAEGRPQFSQAGTDEADRNLPPWIQYYNRLKGQPRLSPWQQDEPESLNVRMVGKWGRGPAARVTGKDSLVYLALGSEVAIFNAVDGHNPRIINEVQCRFVVDNVILRDTVLYAVLQGGVEVFNVANPRSVTRIRYLPISAVDMCINDSMAYTIDADSFKAYRIVSPESLERLGACADSGYYLAADSGFAYACDRWGLYVIDATDPRNPHQVSVLSGGTEARAAKVEGGYCYYSEMVTNAAFVVANVTDPYHPAEVGRLGGITAYDVSKLGFYVYLPGYQIVDVSIPSSPSVIGTVTPGGIGVWTRSPFSHSFIAAGSDGLRTINVNDPVHPYVDTAVAAADISCDVAADAGRAYVANYHAGMKILNTGNPANPFQVGSYDTISEAPQVYTVKARDSFAYLACQWWLTGGFRVIDVSAPDNPTLVGSCRISDLGYASALRDSLVYVAEDYHLEIFSIANPRNPRLVGSCQLAYHAGGLFVKDTFAYVGNVAGIQVVDVKNPANPVLVASHGQLIGSYTLCILDTIAYIGGWDSLRIWNFKDPVNPSPISSAPVQGLGTGVVVVNGKAYVGGRRFEVVDVTNPSAPRNEGYYVTPGWTNNVSYSEPYIYVACADGGVCIFDTTTVSGVAESRPVGVTKDNDQFWIRAFPNPAQNEVELQITPPQTRAVMVKIADVTGRKLIEARLPVAAGKAHFALPRGMMPSGVYFLTARCSTAKTTVKVVKR
jgi:hypothetical protein